MSKKKKFVPQRWTLTKHAKGTSAKMVAIKMLEPEDNRTKLQKKDVYIIVIIRYGKKEKTNQKVALDLPIPKKNCGSLEGNKMDGATTHIITSRGLSRCPSCSYF